MIRDTLKPLASRNSGAALILVLGVLSIISILSLQVIETTNNLAAAQASQGQLQQSYWYAKAGEEYAKIISRDNLYKKMLHAEHTQLRFPIVDGEIQVSLQPMQNCFNLNSLSQRSGIDVFNRVFFDTIDNPNISGDTPRAKAEQALDENLLGLPLKRLQIRALFSEFEINAQRAQFFSDRLIDWLDEDNIPSGSDGAENTYYATASPSRETPNQHLLIAEEVEDFLASDEQEFAAVLPLLCARPGDNKLQVNINQLNSNNAVLLSAILLNKIDLDTAKNIIQERPANGFESLPEFWKLPAFDGLKISIMQKKAFVLENRYYRVSSKVSYKTAKFTLHSLIRVNSKKQVHVISRTYGVNA